MSNLSVNGKTEIYGIIGKPVNHSFSPQMQTQAFQTLGINAVYLPFPMEEESLPQLPQAFEITGVKGFNVTVPYKEKIIPYLDEVDADARLLGSVNTVVRTAKGWVGYSTDGIGFVRSLQEKGVELSNTKILLVGAGGSAKSITIALCRAGISELHILNRTVANAEKLLSITNQITPNLITSINAEAQEEYDILINCTSIGMKEPISPVDDAYIKQSKFVVDIIYNPAKTVLLEKAESYGIPYANGLGMLLYQGTEAFEIWTQQKAPVEVMRKSLLQSIQ